MARKGRRAVGDPGKRATGQRPRRAGPQPRPGSGAGTFRHALTRERGVRVGAARNAGSRRTGMPDEQWPSVAELPGDKPSFGKDGPRACGAGRSVRTGPCGPEAVPGSGFPSAVCHGIPTVEIGMQDVVEDIVFRTQMIPPPRNGHGSIPTSGRSRPPESRRKKPLSGSCFCLHAATVNAGPPD